MRWNPFKRSKRESTSLASHSFWRLAFAPASMAGVKVSETSAMQHAAVYACVKVLSETIASLPLHVYEIEGKKKKKAVNHPLYNILHNRPNPSMTSFSWREMMVSQQQLNGNHYSQIVRNNAGRILGLYPLDASKIEVKHNENGDLIYVYKGKDKEETLMSDEVLPIIGFSLNGITGISQIYAGANAIGLSIATEQYGSDYFKNGSVGSGVLKIPTVLSDDAYNRLVNSWEEKHGGGGNQHKPILLEGGAEWSQIAISNEQSQFLESRKYQLREICRLFRVPPHLVGDLEQATFSNIEHQSIEFAIHTIRPIITRIEQSMNSVLFTSKEKEKYFVKFSLDALLRGDTASRYAAYESAITKGCWMTRNEARELEDLNPVEGLDEMILPLNMTEKGATDEQK